MQFIKVCGLTMAGNVKMFSVWDYLPFRLKRAFHLDIVQDDHAKSNA